MKIAETMKFDTLSDKEFSSGQEEEEEEHKLAGLPHEALFLVLSYLPLFELLSMSEACTSLRDAVEKDVLPWLNLIVERPLNLRLSDEILMKIASKANGKLRALALMYCVKITDEGLHRVIDQNPLITKLHIPGCTSLTPDGVIRAVQKLSDRNRGLESLRIDGIGNMRKEHLDMLQTNQKLQEFKQKRQPQPLLYHNYRKFQAYRWDWEELDRVIDVEVCPKCNEVRVVFDCPREECKGKSDDGSKTGCRMCMFCVSRCEECGKCVENGDSEETVCGDTLCFDCWIQLSKCNFCNEPCCSQHVDMQISSAGSIGWICSVCLDESYGFE